MLLYGVSQGTATLINWLAQQSPEQQKKVGCLTLESILGSGNSAILHTIASFFSPLPTYLPFARLWLPLGAKLACFPTYNPWGKQAVNSAKKISKDIPVIIMHNEGDRQLSINDARNVYCTLTEAGNSNAYLIEVNSGLSHVDILDGDNAKTQKIAAIQAIYKKYNLPYDQKRLEDVVSNSGSIDLTAYQPAIEEVKEKIAQSSWKPTLIRNIVDIATASALGYLAYRWYKKS